jgi:hypothetical protein
MSRSLQLLEVAAKKIKIVFDNRPGLGKFTDSCECATPAPKNEKKSLTAGAV